jgi:hypothetical protein
MKGEKMKRGNDFIAFKLVDSTNPIILRRDVIHAIVPNEDNKLMSRIFTLDSGDGYYLVDESTSSIEGRI